MRYLLISHGPFAKAAVESLQMIMGECSNVDALSVMLDSTIQSTVEEINSVVDSHSEDQFVIVTDIRGGTPFNASYRVLKEKGNCVLISGFNLPLLLDLLLLPSDSLEAVIERVEKQFPKTLTIVQDGLQTSEATDDFDL